MKLRLVNSSYRLLENCVAHGETAGMQWWVVLVPYYEGIPSLFIIIRPTERIDAIRQANGQLNYAIRALQLISDLRPNEYTCPEYLRGAVWITISLPASIMHKGARPSGFMVWKHWLPRKRKHHFGKYIRKNNRYLLTMEEAVICHVDVAEQICEYLLNKAIMREGR